MTIEATVATPTPEAPPAAVPAPAPAPEAAPAPAKRLSADDVLKAFDAEFEKLSSSEGEDEGEEPVEAAEPAPAKEAKEEPAESQEEPEAVAADGEWEDGVVPPKPEESLPNKERAALKAIKDPAIRREFARAHFLVKAYEKSGMRIGDVRRYVAAAPTPEILEERIMRAEQLDAFVDEFSSGDKNAAIRVGEVLRQTSTEGFTAFVDLILDNIHVVRPARMREVGDRYFRAAIANMREKAEEDGDLVLADHADGLESFLGLTAKGKQKAGAREKADVDPETQRRLQEADEIVRRQKQQEAESFKQAYVAFNNAVVQDAVGQAANFAKDWIEENCGAYPNEVKEELFNRLASTVRGHVEGNTVVAKTLQRLMDDGAGDEAHGKRCSEYLVKTIKSVFVTVAPEVLTKIQRIAGPALARRAERTTRARTIRDVGASGAPAVSGGARLSGKGKHIDDVLKEFDALS